jgi:hypothetical protein
MDPQGFWGIGMIVEMPLIFRILLTDCSTPEAVSMDWNIHVADIRYVGGGIIHPILSQVPMSNYWPSVLHCNLCTPVCRPSHPSFTPFCPPSQSMLHLDQYRVSSHLCFRLRPVRLRLVLRRPFYRCRWADRKPLSLILSKSYPLIPQMSR